MNTKNLINKNALYVFAFCLTGFVASAQTPTSPGAPMTTTSSGADDSGGTRTGAFAPVPNASQLSSTAPATNGNNYINSDLNSRNGGGDWTVPTGSGSASVTPGNAGGASSNSSDASAENRGEEFPVRAR